MLDFERYYHIYNHANGDDNMFRESKNYDFFLEKCQFHILPIADTLAWCLMPNHFHFLIKIRSEKEIELSFPKFKTLEKIERRKFLSKQFSNFFSSYSQAFNKVYRRRGSLFLKNFKRKEITSDSYLKNIVLYIHLNPIKHGFTKNLQDWLHTSFNELPSLNPDFMELIFGDKNNYFFHPPRKNIQFYRIRAF